MTAIVVVGENSRRSIGLVALANSYAPVQVFCCDRSLQAGGLPQRVSRSRKGVRHQFRWTLADGTDIQAARMRRRFQLDGAVIPAHV